MADTPDTTSDQGKCPNEDWPNLTHQDRDRLFVAAQAHVSMDNKWLSTAACEAITELEQQVARLSHLERKQTEDTCPFCKTQIWSNDPLIIDMKSGFGDRPLHAICYVTQRAERAEGQVARLTRELESEKRKAEIFNHLAVSHGLDKLDKEDENAHLHAMLEESSRKKITEIKHTCSGYKGVEVREELEPWTPDSIAAELARRAELERRETESNGT